jgi:DNA-binding transcriptional LysR family regulator
MDLRHLRYVIVLAEELHFGRAAERLNTSQPPLSRYIRDVEQELGVRLFYRTKRVVELTDAGARFVEEARRLLTQFENLTRLASRAHNGEIGTLTVGCVTSYNRYLVQCVQAFSQRYPEVRLEFHSMGSDEQVKALKQGRIRVGLVVLPIQTSELATEVISTEPRLLGMPANHPLARRRRIPLASLANERFILFTRSLCSGPYDQIIRTCINAGFSLNVAHEVTNILTAFALVEAGLGVSLFPASVQDFSTKKVIFREVVPPFPPVELALAYRSDDDSPVLKLFLAVAKEVFTEKIRNNRKMRVTRNEERNPAKSDEWLELDRALVSASSDFNPRVSDR